MTSLARDTAHDGAHPGDRQRRPWIPPVLRRLWRDGRTLQFGVDSPHAVTLTDVDPAIARMITALDGRRGEPEVIRTAVETGADELAARALLTELRRTGIVVDRPEHVLEEPSRPSDADRLEPELAGLSLAQAHSGRPAAVALRTRRRSSVVIHGANRVGVTLACLLAAAGVRAVCVVDEGPVHITDAAPGGLRPSDEGLPRDRASAVAIRQAAPGTNTAPPGSHAVPDLVVLTDPWPRLDEVLGALHALGTPHLVATVREGTAVVGPLVVPGQSACLRCHDEHRTDRDPLWPYLALQLRRVRRRPAESGEVAVAALAASVGALQALAWLDGALPAALEATLEADLAECRLNRRSWPPHPRCGCLSPTLASRDERASPGTSADDPASVA